VGWGRGDGFCDETGVPVATSSRQSSGGSPGAALTSGTDEVTYLVLADRAVPYLLARVRWPDVAQAISVARPDWLDDPGLFDLPYDRSAVKVSFSQAASVAASWGRQLQPGAAEGAPSYIRRMPANWSDLSPSERRAWGIEFVGTRNSSPRRVRRSRRTEQKIAAPPATALANGHAAPLEDAGRAGIGVDGPAVNGSQQMGNRMRVATERRGHVRVPVDGRAHIRSGHTTISAGLVDLSESGLRCVLPDAHSLIAPGPALDGPFLLEAEVISSRICLDAAGQISWHRRVGSNMHFGVAFEKMADGDTEGVQRLLAAARNKRGRR
jgi:hypothetical protein